MSSRNGQHMSRHAAKAASKNAARKRAKTALHRDHAPAAPAAFTGNGHAAPDPAQFGARRHTAKPLALPAPDAPDHPVISSTAEAEAVATATPMAAQAREMTQRKPPLPATTKASAPAVIDSLSHGNILTGHAIQGHRDRTPPTLHTSPIGPPSDQRGNPAIAADSMSAMTFRPTEPIGQEGTHATKVGEGWLVSRRDLPMPAFASLHRPATAPTSHTVTADAPPQGTEPVTMAVPLPHADEPLTMAMPPRRPTASRAHGRHPTADYEPLPRDRSLAKPDHGLLGALNTWLRSAGKMLLSGFLVKTKRRSATPPASLRERVELTQLRAENRRLRHQIDGMTGHRGSDAPSSAKRPKH